MLILGFESSAKAASAALCRDGALLSQYYQNSGLTHSRTLLPMAEDMLKNLELTIEDVDLIAVAKGPGSFTGIRIGVSAVKGLAWAAGKPVCGVSTLEAMAWNGLTATEGSIVCCAMDARRSQLYNALFEIRDGAPRRLCEDRAIDLNCLAEEIRKYNRNVFVVGDGAVLCREVLCSSGIDAVIAPEPLRFQTAFGVCMAAKDKPPCSVHELLPTYLRLSQAERERQERMKKDSI